MMRRSLMLAALLGALVAPCTVAAADDPPRAATTSGPLEGVRSDSLAVFRGIPYAVSPVAGLRWRAPQPVPPWRDLRSAAAFGSACQQKAGLSLEGGGDRAR